MSTPEPVNQPISVKPHVAPVVMSESTKAILISAFAILVYQFVKSEQLMAVVIPALGFVATFAWGLAHRIRCWLNLRFLANLPQVPDEVAKVGK